MQTNYYTEQINLLQEYVDYINDELRLDICKENHLFIEYSMHGGCRIRQSVKGGESKRVGAWAPDDFMIAPELVRIVYAFFEGICEGQEVSK